MAFFAFIAGFFFIAFMIGTHSFSHPPEMGGRQACTNLHPCGRHQRFLVAFIAFAFIAFIAMAFMAFIAFAMI